MSDPPISGPKIGTSNIGTPMTLITRPIRLGPATSASIAWASWQSDPAAGEWAMPVDQQLLMLRLAAVWL